MALDKGDGQLDEECAAAQQYMSDRLAEIKSADYDFLTVMKKLRSWVNFFSQQLNSVSARKELDAATAVPMPNVKP